MKHRIVVLGAGYGGAIAAGRIAKQLHRDDVEITMINGDPDFVERVRMHQVATGQTLKHRPLRKVYAGSGVQVRQAWVNAVDADRKTVSLSTESGAEILGYDTLVYALGSTFTDQGVPGVAEYAHNVAGKPAALRLRDRLNEVRPGSTVMVVGGGLTGIEAATEIAESHPALNIAIASLGAVGGWLNEKAQRHLRDVFDRLGITVHENTDITRVEADGVVTASQDKIAAQVTVWTSGFTVHPIAAASTLTVSDTGRIVVDDTMRSVSHPDVYAIGDAAFAKGVGGEPLRMSCAAAVPMSWQAADALAARLTGREVSTTPIGYSNQCISLGRRDGIIQRVTPEDQPTSNVRTGRFAAFVKEIICAGAAWSIYHPTMLKPSRRRRIVESSKPASRFVTP
jgi:NADH dehydrogenase